MIGCAHVQRELGREYLVEALIMSSKLSPRKLVHDHEQ